MRCDYDYSEKEMAFEVRKQCTFHSTHGYPYSVDMSIYDPLKELDNQYKAMYREERERINKMEG